MCFSVCVIVLETVITKIEQYRSSLIRFTIKEHLLISITLTLHSVTEVRFGPCPPGVTIRSER